MVPHAIERRVLLRAAGAAGFAAAAAPWLKAGTALAAATEIAWLTYTGASKEEYLKGFLAENPVTIKRGFNSSDDEQFAQMRAGAIDQWEIITPSWENANKYINAGMLQPIDMAQLPNAAMLYDEFKENPLGTKDGKRYVLPNSPGDMTQSLTVPTSSRATSAMGPSSTRNTRVAWQRAIGRSTASPWPPSTLALPGTSSSRLTPPNLQSAARH